MPKGKWANLAPARQKYTFYLWETAEQGGRQAVADNIGLSYDYLNHIMCRLRTEGWTIEDCHPDVIQLAEDDKQDLVPIFWDKKTSKVNWRKSMKMAIEMQHLYCDADASQSVASIEIPTNRPICIINSADWQLGSVSTDYETWQEHIRLILDTPGVFLATVGDLVDNFRYFRNLQAVFQQVWSPKHQYYVLEAVLKELLEKKKLLFTTWGDHDTLFDERIYGQSLAAEICRNEHIVHLRDLGFVRLLVGETNYTSLFIHKTRYSSFRNALHGAKRMYEIRFPADIIVTAHQHTPAMEWFCHYQLADDMGYGFGGECWLIRVGAYKSQGDSYSRRFWGRGIVGLPTLVLYPDRHKMVAFAHPEDAIMFMHSEWAAYDFEEQYNAQERQEEEK